MAPNIHVPADQLEADIRDGTIDNSYKRFQPGSWAPTAIGWATDNRTLGFRVVGHGPGMRVESRIPGADVNAYHAFAATIAGGLHGIRERIEPGVPYEGNGYAADELPRIPATFVEGIELWRTSTATSSGSDASFAAAAAPGPR